MKQLYLRVFPRPHFTDLDLRRLSNVCADVNGMTIIILLIFILQNVFAKVTSLSATMVIVLGIVYLAVERVLIFKGQARLTIFAYGLAIGAAWLGLTFVAGSLRHTQSMILLIGIAYVTITLGGRKGAILVTIYTAFVLMGWYIEADRSGFQITVTDQMRFVSAAILSMVLLTTVCGILREHLVENYRLALIDRDHARDELISVNQRLEDSLKTTQGDLTQAVEITNSALFKQQQFDTMDVMVSGLSHEMGTPVGNAKLSSENLVAWVQEIRGDLTGGNARTQKLLANISESAEIVGKNLTRADDLLKSFKRLSLDQTGTEMRDFNLAETIDRAIFAMKPELAGVALEVDLNREIAMKSLPYAVEQIVSNLLANAVKHGLDNSAAPRITVSTAVVPESSNVCIVVADNGHGIDSEILPKIFNPFFTTKRGRGGTGVGLNVVRYLTETVLGGTIEVSSSSEGTRFTITMPRVTTGVWASGITAPVTSWERTPA